VQGKVVTVTQADERSSTVPSGALPTSEDDTVNTFELFFDPVYVFAINEKADR
jgi:low temperature requirement protein LtrA